MKPVNGPCENQNIYIPLRTYQQKRGDLFIEQVEGSMKAEQIELHRTILKIDKQEHVTRAVDALRHE